MKHVIKTVCSLLMVATLASCGGNSNEQKTTEKKANAEEVKEDIKKDQEVIEIKVAAIGESMAEIAYEPQSLNVKAGSKIKLTFENKSSAAGMLHNFVLVELGVGQDIATAGIKAGKDNNFVPKDDRVIFYTEVLDLGETIQVEFDAPKKGSYHYICTYPGHYPKMIGRLNVQ